MKELKDCYRGDSLFELFRFIVSECEDVNAYGVFLFLFDNEYEVRRFTQDEDAPEEKREEEDWEWEQRYEDEQKKEREQEEQDNFETWVDEVGRNLYEQSKEEDKEIIEKIVGVHIKRTPEEQGEIDKLREVSIYGRRDPTKPGLMDVSDMIMKKGGKPAIKDYAPEDLLKYQIENEGEQGE